ncbi:MAG: alpha-galactosidase [Candidatus Ruminococcus intestinipullorum]|nr:alpha-galactosidase [Candidatus Ruminococcus intestinipullorum]
MEIQFYEQQKVFMLHTENTTYSMAIVDDCYLEHLYYGSKIQSPNIRYILREDEPPFVPSKNLREKEAFLDCAPMEYPESGMGDYRESAICIRSVNGHRGSELCYSGYTIEEGKPVLEGLPATWGSEKDSMTLKVYLKDQLLGIKATLQYSIFEGIDAIMRSVIVENEGKEVVYLEKVLSACLDMEDRGFEVMGLFGAWGRERHIQRIPVGYGRQNIASFRGKSSHQENPFMALVTPETTQDFGEVYAMNFVYSGNFIAQVEKNQFDSLRMTMGIHPEGFTWKLNPKEKFIAPEVVMVYSSKGLGEMTRTFHNLYRSHLIRSKYLHTKRPILINNWEATYFDFDEKKLLEIAKEASKLGIEMLVMDDGWFGNRNNDDSSLGDWFVNEEKLKGGLHKLVEDVKKTGMKFGIWVEPEMISPNSLLYQAHPDWAIQIPQRSITQSRAQYVLDFSREDVVEAVYQMISNILRSADISYVKWDMNRQLTTLGSANLKADQQGELYHRYMLGVYKMQERLVTEFPDILLENCSGGGARFDAGMLYYSPQIWCSDNTDAIERLAIQEGTALLYPVSTIGSHVSVCPNHTVGRDTPFETRGDVALFGTFGYELDVTKLSDAEKELVKEQTQNYHKYNDLIREGDYYRLASVSENGHYDSWMVVSNDRDKALLFYVQVQAKANLKSRFIRLKGLSPEKIYILNGQEYTGDILMKVGARISPEFGDFKSKILELFQK